MITKEQLEKMADRARYLYRKPSESSFLSGYLDALYSVELLLEEEE